MRSNITAAHLSRFAKAQAQKFVHWGQLPGPRIDGGGRDRAGARSRYSTAPAVGIISALIKNLYPLHFLNKSPIAFDP